MESNTAPAQDKGPAKPAVDPSIAATGSPGHHYARRRVQYRWTPDSQHQAAVQTDGGEEGLGPVLHLQRAHQDQDRRPDTAGQQAGADTRDRAPGPPSRSCPSSSAITSCRSSSSTSRFPSPDSAGSRVNVFMQRGFPAMVLRYITARHAAPGIARPARYHDGPGPAAARAHSHGRLDRLGQVHLVGGDDQLPQRECLRPHCHH